MRVVLLALEVALVRHTSAVSKAAAGLLYQALVAVFAAAVTFHSESTHVRLHLLRIWQLGNLLHAFELPRSRCPWMFVQEVSPCT